jgi:extracellular elastinolytic metalloproteinase
LTKLSSWANVRHPSRDVHPALDPCALGFLEVFVRLRQLFVWTLLTLSVAGTVAAQEPRDFGAGSARVDRADNGRALTGPSASTRPEIVTEFLRTRHSAATLQSLVAKRENPARNGVVHIDLGQRIAGLDVYGTYVRAAVNAGGQLLSVVENLAEAPPALVPATEDHRAALDTVLTQYYIGPDATIVEAGRGGETVRFTRGARFTEEPTVTRVAVPMANGAMQTGYLVVTWDHDNILRHTVVGAGGRVLVEELRTNTDTYKIFPIQPILTPQVVVSGPGAGNAQSPSGWVTADTTTGNNVDAYLDRDNNNGPDANGRPVSAGRTFEYTVDLAQSPTTTTNQMAGVTNLFYLNNVIHDKLYRHGFTESAGNFQANNFGKGGAGNDPVMAEAQDGGGTNNANFATPADGSRPRMQMYLWTRTTPSRDGDLDSDIVWHEYGHGLTWRMIGNMSGPFAGAIGEGMSDTLAIYINNDDRVGEYSYNSSTGIRRYRYSGYPLTYGDLTGSSVHGDGEIYAATMWKLRDLWAASGRTEDALFDVVIDGMNYTPARPKYESMRDGLLAAAPTQAEDCIIWEAFAQFGIGVGALGTESCNIFRCTASVTESFAVPSICTAGPPPNSAPSVSISSPTNNASFVEGTAITFTGSASDEDGNLSAGLTWKIGEDEIGTSASFSTSSLAVGTHVVTASVMDSGGLTGSASVTITVTSSGGSGIQLTATGRKVKGVNTVDLLWSGATGTAVDIYRNSTKIVTANDGAYTDSAGKGGMTLTYKVCLTGSTTSCSAPQTIVF